MTFKLIETKQLNDIHSVGKLYEHEETGAQVLHLDNDDTNKAFTIAFKTPPYDDNGIAHILEHSVLNGSKKFPSKEPFVELIKGSLNTFVNAMTFSDKTIYPVASTNQKDFSNLMSVYLDAVFQPLIYTNSQILEQEGWHYHLENAEDDLIYKGVVYNEMKGATASPDSQLYTAIQKYLYKGTPYEFESGGLPSAIPSLTQEDFIDFHKKYYHPSSSLTILYGDLDTDHAFDLLASYFDGKGTLDESSTDLTFEATQPEEQDVELTYSITDGDDPKDKDYLAIAWHTATASDSLEQHGLRVLAEILFGNNQAPLKKALLDAQIGGDIDGDFFQAGFPAVFSIDAKYSDTANMDRFKEVVETTLTQLVEDGISKELIKAALNKITFRLKESVISESNPRGVLYAISSLNTWLYDLSPFESLEFSDKLDLLAKLSEEGYFEQLIQDKLLNNTKRVNIKLKADPGKNDAIEKETLAKLQEYKASLSDTEIDALVEQTQSLIARQEAPDKPEDLATIPTLDKSDLSTETEDYPLEESSLFEGTTLYHADQFTSGIDYLDFYFDVSDFEADDYLLLSYLSQLLGDLPTENYSVAELQTQIDLHTGGINGGVIVFETVTGELKPYFTLRGKALEESFSKLVDLIHEIMTSTQFTDNTELLNITQRHISDFEDDINHGAHVLAAARALSQVKPVSKLGEMINGIDQFNFTKEILEKLKVKDVTELSEKLEAMLNRLLNKQRINALYIGEASRLEEVTSALTTTFDSLSSEPLGEPVIYQAGEKMNEAFVTAQDVNYVGFASDATGELAYSGSSLVLSTFLRYDYLWNNIRVKGGAYGSMFRHNLNGDFQLSSYRDPNIRKTIDAYHGIPEFIETLELDEASLLKSIIGTLSNLDQPLSAYHKGKRAFSRHQVGRTTADVIQLKEEVLATTEANLTALSEGFKTVLNKGTIAVIGNKAQIEQDRDHFDEIHELY
ncbi:insulinase family protein [Aerococcaceae bacterium DSM 111021]|nr:insulinase family protein [Aerococcaceae bacterium DSM 111021]